VPKTQFKNFHFAEHAIIFSFSLPRCHLSYVIICHLTTGFKLFCHSLTIAIPRGAFAPKNPSAAANLHL
jgi:hypothetical protein